MRHTLFPLLLAIFLAVGCAHSPQPAPSLEPSIESSQPRPDVIPSASGQISINTPERSATSVVAGADGMGKGSANEALTVADNQGTQESPPVPATSGTESADDGKDAEYSDDVTEKPAATIEDPLEPFNRAMHTFNDRLYFWVLKPVAQGYNAVVPESARVSVSNFFSNLRAPIRLVNCVLQANPIGAATELFRFMINSTVGLAGLFDPAGGEEINLQKQDEDFGQTLGVYGIGQGFYIVWPISGPSSSRDTVGMIGDYFSYPISYLDPWYVWTAVRGYEAENEVSLKIGDYEALKEAAIDPYVAVRDAYVQYRQNKVQEKGANPKPSKPVSQASPAKAPAVQ